MTVREIHTAGGGYQMDILASRDGVTVTLERITDVIDMGRFEKQTFAWDEWDAIDRDQLFRTFREGATKQ